MLARRILSYALLPLQALFCLLEATSRFLWMVIICSNPLFLAIWLMHHNQSSRKEVHRS